MSTEVITVDLDESLRLAEDIMEMGRIRHLPVMKDDKLVGIVSQRDLFRSSLSTLLRHDRSDVDLFEESVNMKEIMTDKVVTVSQDLSLKEAAALMLTKKIGCMPVVDEEGRLLGLITETDVLRCFVLGDEG
jgi:CBS domain-containing protein